MIATPKNAAKHSAPKTPRKTICCSFKKSISPPCEKTAWRVRPQHARPLRKFSASCGETSLKTSEFERPESRLRPLNPAPLTSARGHCHGPLNHRCQGSVKRMGTRTPSEGYALGAGGFSSEKTGNEGFSLIISGMIPARTST